MVFAASLDYKPNISQDRLGTNIPVGKPSKEDTVAFSQEELQQMLDVATPHQLAEYGRKSPETAGGDVEAAPAHVSIVAPHLLAALACEKYGMDDEALAYIGVVSDLHPKLGGVEAP